jgi:hypothetical protein
MAEISDFGNLAGLKLKKVSKQKEQTAKNVILLGIIALLFKFVVFLGTWVVYNHVMPIFNFPHLNFWEFLGTIYIIFYTGGVFLHKGYRFNNNIAK